MGTAAKELVIAKFQANRKRSLEFLASLTETDWERYMLGTWHLHQVVAHLIGWSYESARAMGELANGLPPSYDAYDTGDDWSEINAIFLRKYGGGSSSELIDQLRASGEYAVTQAEKLPNEAFEEANGVFRKNRQWTVYIELDDTADHERGHIDRVMEALGHQKP